MSICFSYLVIACAKIFFHCEFFISPIKIFRFSSDFFRRRIKLSVMTSTSIKSKTWLEIKSIDLSIEDFEIDSVPFIKSIASSSDESYWFLNRSITRGQALKFQILKLLTYYSFAIFWHFLNFWPRMTLNLNLC